MWRYDFSSSMRNFSSGTRSNRTEMTSGYVHPTQRSISIAHGAVGVLESRMRWGMMPDRLGLAKRWLNIWGLGSPSALFAPKPGRLRRTFFMLRLGSIVPLVLVFAPSVLAGCKKD